MGQSPFDHKTAGRSTKGQKPSNRPLAQREMTTNGLVPGSTLFHQHSIHSGLKYGFRIVARESNSSTSINKLVSFAESPIIVVRYRIAIRGIFANWNFRHCSQVSCLSLKNLQTLPEIHHPLPGTALPPHRGNARIQSANKPPENQ